MTPPIAAGGRLSVIAAVHPLAVGAGPFNTAMVRAMRERGEVDVISWRRMYPPLAYRGDTHDRRSRPSRSEAAAFMLDWHDPLSWRRAMRRVAEFQPRALVLPWLHPVMAPPYRHFLRRAPGGVARVVICHNVALHEPFPLAERLTRRVLRHADLVVVHADSERGELARLGLGGLPVLHAFVPRFRPDDLAVPPDPEAVREERARQGDPDLLLLCFGAVRPYKGVDLAIEAVARVDPALHVRLVVAGRFWEGVEPYAALVRQLGLDGRVELRDGYLSHEESALLFTSADAALLPYRSATQSGVVPLAHTYGCPVIATRVGGLPEAVADGRDGLLCPPGDPDALARAIERMAVDGSRLRAELGRAASDRSFDRYAALIERSLDALAA